jgi:uncharacterized protein (DUF2141 family)
MNKPALLFILLASWALPAAAQAADIEVTLTGVREGGELFVGLQDRGQFMQASDKGETVVAPGGGTATVTLRNVTPGEYAIVAWHDDNKNGQFDAGGPNQPPLDGWAMSNFDNPTGPPAFDQVKVTVGAEGGKFSLAMNYSR